jgi:murein DD-endopeptidase MepM/ murein hydrolase activator NlpD
VQSGETLWVISRRHGLSVEALAAANHLRLTAILQPGQTLVVPGAAGPKAAAPPPARAPRRAAPTTVHTVRSGETLWDIARRNDTQVEDLMALNDLGHSEWIKPGQRLLIAGSLPRSRRIGTQARSGSRVVMADASALRAAGTFLWPARGVLTSRFGRRWRTHHDGIDVAGPRGTPIYAARDGVVEDAGWMAGYGRAVRLGHGGGLTTMYGHASVLYVTPGQRVKKGQLIARVGCTGSCTGSHLHFEVRIGGHPVDPLRYLR